MNGALSTPSGLLFNELRHAPSELLRSVDALLRLALDLDTGRFDSGATAGPATLFAVRLAVRVQGAALACVRHADWIAADAAGAASAAGAAGGSGAGRVARQLSRGRAHVRDLALPPASLAAVRAGLAQLTGRLQGSCLRLLQRWLKRCLAHEDQGAEACVLHAHMALIFSHVGDGAAAGPHELDGLAVRCLVEAQVFLTHSFAYDAEPPLIELETPESAVAEEEEEKQQQAAARAHGDAAGRIFGRLTGGLFGGGSKTKGGRGGRGGGGVGVGGGGGGGGGGRSNKYHSRANAEEGVDGSLGIAQTELFDLFQRHRNAVLRFLGRCDPRERDAILDAAVAAATRTAPKPARDATAAVAAAGAAGGAGGEVGGGGGGAAGPSTTLSSAASSSEPWLAHATGRFCPASEAPAPPPGKNFPGGYREFLLEATLTGAKTEVDLQVGSRSEHSLVEINRCPRCSLRVRTYYFLCRGLPSLSPSISQIGEYTVAKNQMRPIDRGLLEARDFIAVFGGGEGGVGVLGAKQRGVQVAETVVTETRQGWNLVGQRMDLVLWTAPPTAFHMHGQVGGAFTPEPALSGGRGAAAAALEESILASLDPRLRSALRRVAWRPVALDGAAAGQHVRLTGVASDGTRKELVLYRCGAAGGGQDDASGGGGAPSGAATDDPDDPDGADGDAARAAAAAQGVAHVFNIVEHGRKHYRSLVFTSDERWSLASAEQLPSPGVASAAAAMARGDEGNAWASKAAGAAVGLALGGYAGAYAGSKAGEAVGAGLAESAEKKADDYAVSHLVGRGNLWCRELSAPSLVITRKDKKGADELFLPPRLLRGLLPEALLAGRRFWQRGDGSIAGEHCGPKGSDDAGTELRLSPLGSGGGVAVTRTSPGLPPQRLVNLLAAAPGSAAHALAATLARLDCLSHALAWTEVDGNAASSSSSSSSSSSPPAVASLVELPRLRLSFKREGAVLSCCEHSGFHLFLGGRAAMPPPVRRLLRGLPHASLLAGGGGELQILLPATAKPLLPAPAGLGLGDVALDRSDPDWNASVGPVPYHLCVM